MLGAITIVSALADLAAGPRPHGAGPGPLNEFGAMFSFLLLFGLFSFTEAGSERGIGSYPRRLFTLPVTTLRLVAVPMASGIVAVELLYLVWMRRLTTSGTTSPLTVAVLLAAFLVFYQTVLWTLPQLGTLRLVVVGAIGMSLFAIGLLPAPEGDTNQWLTPELVSAGVGVAAVASFFFAWRRLARLRAGGDGSSPGLGVFHARVVDSLPGQRGAFPSPGRAQFWYEWRNGGAVLPVLVGAVLLLAALSVSLSHGIPGNGFAFVLAALTAPIVLAVPVGLAFAKPMFWTENLSLPPYIAVRPVGAADLITVKLKVAAVSTALSWAIVLAGLGGWLALGGNAEGLSQFAIQLWAFHGHSVTAVLGIAVLVVTCGMLLTWRFLVVDLWAGYSGNRRLYEGSVLSVVLVVAVGIAWSANELPVWVLADPARMLPLVWSASLAVVAKYWLAARTWRGADVRFARGYFAVWLLGSAALVALGLVFWRVATVYLPVDSYRLQGLLILLALLVVPMARVGLAPTLLERNRHRQ